MTEAKKGQQMSDSAGEISKGPQSCWARLRIQNFNEKPRRWNRDADRCLRVRNVHFGLGEENGLDQNKCTLRKAIEEGQHILNHCNPAGPMVPVQVWRPDSPQSSIPGKLPLPSCPQSSLQGRATIAREAGQQWAPQSNLDENQTREAHSSAGGLWD